MAAQDIDLSGIAVAIVEFDSTGRQSPIALSAHPDLIREVAKRLVAELQEHEGKPTARGAMATVRLTILRHLAGVPPQPDEGEPIATPAWWSVFADAITTTDNKEDIQ